MMLQGRFVFALLCIVINQVVASESNVTVTTTENNVTVNCVREHLYDDWDVKNALGIWKVVEVYLHLDKERVTQFKCCPTVTIWEVPDPPKPTFGPSSESPLYHVQHIKARFRQEYRHLRLLWDEAGQTSEYALYFRNESAGYWQVFDGQNGTMALRSNYQQFSGTIQVLKAVNDHLVLNFCQEPANGRPAQLYSVLFSRDPVTMARWEVESVHNMLQSKKLSVASRRMVCGNGAAKLFTSTFTSALAFILIYIFKNAISS